jgi:hypothetical protein
MVFFGFFMIGGLGFVLVPKGVPDDLSFINLFSFAISFLTNHYHSYFLILVISYCLVIIGSLVIFFD